MIKPWPDIGPCRPGWYDYPAIPDECRARIHPYMVENSEIGEWYHKDVYDAVMARLRLAVEALKAVQAESRSPDALSFEANYDKIVMDAINSIGPLPNERR